VAEFEYRFFRPVRVSVEWFQEMSHPPSTFAASRSSDFVFVNAGMVGQMGIPLGKRVGGRARGFLFGGQFFFCFSFLPGPPFAGECTRRRPGPGPLPGLC